MVYKAKTKCSHLVFTSPRWTQYFQGHQSTHKLLMIKATKVTCNNHLISCVCECISTLIISTIFPCMEVEHACIPAPPNCPWPPLTLFNRSLSLSPSLQLLVKTDKPPACCHMELINRTGGGIKDSLISTQIKRHFGFHPTRRLAALAGPEASVCFR